MQLLLIVALGLAILTVIFALQNPIPVGVTFLLWKFEGSLALVLISTFALGVLVSLLISILAIVKRRSAIANQSKRIAELENRSRNGSHRLDESCATGIVFWFVHLMRQLPSDPTRTTVDSPSYE
jgi:uncharacterized integral membrane protein